MAAGRKLAFHVTVADPKGEQHTFGPDSTLPDWARKAITNPSAWDGDDAAEPSGGDGADGDGPVDYSKMRVEDLQKEIDRRNADRSEDGQIEVGGKGNKPDLVAALEADDAASGA